MMENEGGDLRKDQMVEKLRFELHETGDGDINTWRSVGMQIKGSSRSRTPYLWLHG